MDSNNEPDKKEIVNDEIASNKISSKSERKLFNEILSAALQVLSESGGEKQSNLWFGSGEIKRINATKLAEVINDNRHRWPSLKNEPVGSSFRHITEVLQKALKSTDKDPVSTD